MVIKIFVVGGFGRHAEAKLGVAGSKSLDF
jgi:hypothetical protein